MYDSLSPCQRVGLLHDVARHLLTETESALPLSAPAEATVAATYVEIRDQVAIEIDLFSRKRWSQISMRRSSIALPYIFCWVGIARPSFESAGIGFNLLTFHVANELGRPTGARYSSSGRNTCKLILYARVNRMTIQEAGFAPGQRVRAYARQSTVTPPDRGLPISPQTDVRIRNATCGHAG